MSNFFRDKYTTRFLPGLATNVLSPRHTVITDLTAFKPISNRDRYESHERYKGFQQRADHFAHLSTLDFAPSIKHDLIRISKTYVVKELKGREEHTDIFYGGKSDQGHQRWEKTRKESAELK